MHAFVYGTLRSGGSNHFRLDEAVCLGPATVRGQLYRVDWYPGLVLDEIADSVVGEVYELSPGLLRELDEFEGLSAGEMEGSEYRRVRTQIHGLPGVSTAWVWEWIGSVRESDYLHHGDWLRYLEENGQ